MPATIVFDVQPDAIEMCDESEAEDAEPTRKASPPTKMKGKRALSEMAATPGTADSSRKTKRAMAEQQSAPGSLLPSPAGVALSPTKTPSKSSGKGPMPSPIATSPEGASLPSADQMTSPERKIWMRPCNECGFELHVRRVRCTECGAPQMSKRAHQAEKEAQVAAERQKAQD